METERKENNINQLIYVLMNKKNKLQVVSIKINIYKKRERQISFGFYNHEHSLWSL
jgi:hypothetical protein